MHKDTTESLCLEMLWQIQWTDFITDNSTLLPHKLFYYSFCILHCSLCILYYYPSNPRTFSMPTFVAQGQTKRQNIWSEQITSDWMTMTPCPHWHTSQFQFKPCKFIFCHVLCYVCKCLTQLVTPVMFSHALCFYTLTWLVLCFIMYCLAEMLMCFIKSTLFEFHRPMERIFKCFLTWIVCCVLNLAKTNLLLLLWLSPKWMAKGTG